MSISKMSVSIATRYEYARASDGSWTVWERRSGRRIPNRAVIHLIARKWQAIKLVEELTEAARDGYAEGYRDGFAKAEGRS